MIRRIALATAVLMGCALVTVAPASASPTAPGRLPAQFIAKLYTEALGRAPDAEGWAAHLAAYSERGCTRDSLATAVRAFYLSPEFLGLPYGPAARVIALYRGALNREPDQAGLDRNTSQLEGAALTWPQVVDAFATGIEFAKLWPKICGSATSYQYGTVPAPSPRPSSDGFAGGDGSELQALLDAAPAGSTVYIARMAVVRLSKTLVVPAGKTLATQGLPSAREYANQGRLVRTDSLEGPMVRLEGGALRNVWVDGQRGRAENYTLDAINVQVMGGKSSAVTGAKLSNSRGWTNLQAFGSNEGFPCQGLAVVDNVITAYSSENVRRAGQGRWTDGISVSCERATIQGNEVIDTTDVGIVIFRASPAVQRSVVRDNLVLSAGNPAFAAIGIDGLYGKGVTHDFTGTSITGNEFWTSPDTHYEIGITIGTRPWFGQLNDAGTGASVTNNTTGGQVAVVSTGIAVGGMHKATVQGNDLRLSVRPVSACPQTNFGVDSEGYAEGGDFQPGATPVRFTNNAGGGCISG
jgi:Domain of unknown function (DUF4214)